MAAGPRNNKVGAIIQARMQSSRLPGKILLPLPVESVDVLLSWPVQRLKQSNRVSDIILATCGGTDNSSLKDFCDQQTIFFYTGSENDVLSRFVEAAEIHRLDTIVRITGDNPIIDEKLIDQLIDRHIDGGYDYSHSVHLPVGMNIEVVKMESLQKINDRNDLTAADREHVTNFFAANTEYKTLEFDFKIDINEHIRLTVDYPADYALLNIIAGIARSTKLYGIALIQHIAKTKEWIFEINGNQYQKRQYNSLEEELVDSTEMLRICEFNRTLELVSENRGNSLASG